MKYRARVVANDPSEDDCPFPGCVRVIHPKIFGVMKSIEELSDPKDILAAHHFSPWVRPHYAHPMDFYTPFIGEIVFIEQVEDGEGWIWTGVSTGEAVTEPLSGKTREGLNYNNTTSLERIFGMRNGSFLKFSDFEDSGRFVLEVLGPNSSHTDRKGPAIVIQGDQGKHSIALTDGEGGKSFFFDSDPDSQVVAVTDKTNNSGLLMKPDIVELYAFNNASLAMKTDEILLKDGSNNKVKLSGDGIVIEDANGNKITLASEGVKVHDANGNEVIMDSAGVKLKTGDASTWLPNILGTCPFTGVPHGGAGAGIVKLTGG